MPRRYRLAPSQTERMCAAWACLPEPTPEELSYLAGFFDGEGCIYLNRSNKKEAQHSVEGAHSIHVTVTNTYKPSIDQFQHFFGGKVTLQHRNAMKPHWKDRWLWRVSGLTAGRFLTMIEPRLMEKRKRATAALFFCDSVAWPKLRSDQENPDGSAKIIQPRYVLAGDALRLRRIAINGLIQHSGSLRGRARAQVG